jgi:hypothetical protein
MALLSNVSNWLTRRGPENESTEEARASALQTGEVLRRLPTHNPFAPAESEGGKAPLEGREPAEVLRESIDPLRQRLVIHPIYGAVNSLPRLCVFMATHVFAVWDFMCLAKRLQRDFTSLDTLWLPPKRPELARFINGLVHGEESDVDPDGKVASHLQLYLDAMDEVGAPSMTMRRFLSLLEYGADVEVALSTVEAPLAARVFVENTLDTVNHGSSVQVLASFLYGREDLIPAMFARILPRWQKSRQAKSFAYYVDRHIELDGDDHGPAAQRALAELCGTDVDAWQDAYAAAEQAMRARLDLWDAVVAELKSMRI